MPNTISTHLRRFLNNIAVLDKAEMWIDSLAGKTTQRSFLSTKQKNITGRHGRQIQQSTGHTHQLSCRWRPNHARQVWCNERHSRLNIFVDHLLIICQINSLSTKMKCKTELFMLTYQNHTFLLLQFPSKSIIDKQLCIKGYDNNNCNKVNKSHY